MNRTTASPITAQIVYRKDLIVCRENRPAPERRILRPRRLIGKQTYPLIQGTQFIPNFFQRTSRQPHIKRERFPIAAHPSVEPTHTSGIHARQRPFKYTNGNPVSVMERTGRTIDSGRRGEEPLPRPQPLSFPYTQRPSDETNRSVTGQILVEGRVPIIINNPNIGFRRHSQVVEQFRCDRPSSHAKNQVGISLMNIFLDSHTTILFSSNYPLHV